MVAPNTIRIFLLFFIFCFGTKLNANVKPHLAAGLNLGAVALNFPNNPQAVRPHFGASARYSLQPTSDSPWQFGVDIHVGIAPRVNQDLKNIEWKERQPLIPRLKDFSYFHVGPAVRYEIVQHHSLLVLPMISFHSYDFEEGKHYLKEDEEELKMSFQTLSLGLGSSSVFDFYGERFEVDFISQWFLKSHHWTLADKEENTFVKTVDNHHQNIRTVTVGLFMAIRYRFF